MRALSLQSDIENEVWTIMKELVEEHGMTPREARSAVEKAAAENERDFFAHMST